MRNSLQVCFKGTRRRHKYDIWNDASCTIEAVLRADMMRELHVDSPCYLLIVLLIAHRFLGGGIEHGSHVYLTVRAWHLPHHQLYSHLIVELALHNV